jgi:hypothetical protein
MLYVEGHRIPTQNENQGDGLDVITDGNGRGRAPFSGKVIHVHEFKKKSNGYYIIIEGSAKTKTGTNVKLKAAIAHLTSTVKEKDTVCVGQPLGPQKTDTILHLELYNPDNQHPVLGDESKLPGDVNRKEFEKLPDNKAGKLNEKYWRPAFSYHQTLLKNIQAVLSNKTFGH